MKVVHKGFESNTTSSYELPTFQSPLVDMQTFKRRNNIDVFLKDGEDFPKIKMSPLRRIRQLFHIKVYESDDITVCGRFELSGMSNQYELVRYGICNKCGLIGRL